MSSFHFLSTHTHTHRRFTMLTPACKPLLKRGQPETEQVKSMARGRRWSSTGLLWLHRRWRVHCLSDQIHQQMQRPWFTAQLQKLLQTRDAAFRAAKSNLSRSIKQRKVGPRTESLWSFHQSSFHQFERHGACVRASRPSQTKGPRHIHSTPSASALRARTQSQRGEGSTHPYCLHTVYNVYTIFIFNALRLSNVSPHLVVFFFYRAYF